MSATSMSKQIIDTNAFYRARKLMNCLDRQSLTMDTGIHREDM